MLRPVPSNPGKDHSAAVQVNEEQNIVGHQTTPGQHLDCEEVYTGQHRHMGLNKLLPGRVLASFRRRREAMPLQNVPDRLIRYPITEIRHSARDPAITPTRVFPSHLQDQRLQFRLKSRSAGVGAVSGSIKLAGNQLAVPGENRIGLGHAGHLSQSLAPEPLTKLGQPGSLRIGQAQPSWQVSSEDAVFGSQVLILKKQFLVHQAWIYASTRTHLLSFIYEGS